MTPSQNTELFKSNLLVCAQHQYHWYIILLIFLLMRKNQILGFYAQQFKISFVYKSYITIHIHENVWLRQDVFSEWDFFAFVSMIHIHNGYFKKYVSSVIHFWMKRLSIHSVMQSCNRSEMHRLCTLLMYFSRVLKPYL